MSQCIFLRSLSISFLSTSFLSMSSLAIFLCVFLSTLVGAEQAYSQERGRLPSGQAYRTNANGTQIVDYIAELEVENEALERRANTLEDDLQQLRSRMKRGVSNTPLQERTLGVQQKALSQTKRSANCDCTELLCDTFISEVKARHRVALGQQQTLLATVKQEKMTLQQEQLRCASELDTYRTQVSTQAAQSASLTDEQNKQLRIVQSSLQRSQQEISRLQNTEATLLQDNQVLKQQLVDARQEIKAAQAKNTEMAKAVRVSSEPVVANNARVRGSISLASTVPQNTDKKLVERRTPAEKSESTPSRVITSNISTQRRSTLISRLRSILKLQKQRDVLFTSYRSSAIRVQKKSILSKRGRTPGALLTESHQVQDARRFRDMEQEALRMQKLVQSDIALMKRLRSNS